MHLAATTLRNADYFILVGYFVLMLGIGAYFYRYMRGMKDYFSGGNRIPWWLSGASFYMSCFSVFGFVVYSGIAFKYGWVAVTIFWGYIPATLMSAYIFAPRWRRARIDSPVEYLEARYNTTFRQLCAWQGVPVKIIDDALKIVAIGLFFSKSLGLDFHQSMLWSALIMMAYTFMGGLWAVTVTDFIQFIVMLAAVIVLLPLALHKAGGLSAFIGNSPEGFFKPVCDEFNWFYMFCMVFLFALSFTSVHWQLIQRYTCVRNEKETHRVGKMVTVLHLVTPIIMFVPAMAARQFLPLDTPSEQVYPLLCVTLLPTGMIGLIIAAMFAATMSMLSSDYNVCASVLTNDVYRRLICPNASQKKLVFVGRLMTLLIGLIALGIAFGIDPSGDALFRTMVQLFSIATAPVAIPMIAGLLWKQVNSKGALAGFLAGLGVGMGLFFFFPELMGWLGLTVTGEDGSESVKWLGLTLKRENVILFSTSAATFIFMAAVSLLTGQSTAEKGRIAAFLRRLESPIGSLPEDGPGDTATESSRAISPFGIVGISIMIIAGMMLAILPFVGGGLAFKMDLGIALALLAIGIILLACAPRKGKPDSDPRSQDAP